MKILTIEEQQALEKKLIIGAKIRLGKEFKEFCEWDGDDIITLVDGTFEYDNELYTEYQSSPAIWNEDDNEYDSIYHLFGNHFEHFFDCEIL